MRRLAAGSRFPALYPRCPVVPAYWWDGHRNFGDALTPWLLPRVGLLPVRRTAADSRLVGVGSIIEHLPEEYAGTVWGTGLMHDHPVRLPAADVRAVRGRLTAERLGRDPERFALGDPGILVSRFVRRPARRWELGLVPNAHHRGHRLVRALKAAHPERIRVVDVTAPPSRAIAQIAGCDAIVTSSLHGLIAADAYGIPALWVELDPPLYGGDFKFLDHESVTCPGGTRRGSLTEGTTVEHLLHEVRPADAEAVRSSQEALLRVTADLVRDLEGSERSPLSAWRHLFSG